MESLLHQRQTDLVEVSLCGKLLFPEQAHAECLLCKSSGGRLLEANVGRVCDDKLLVDDHGLL